MPSKSKPLTDKELAAYEAERDLVAELLQAVQEMKAGQLHVVSSPVIEARKKTGLSQSQFAALMGVSVRTLQGWEQGRKLPSAEMRDEPEKSHSVCFQLAISKQMDLTVRHDAPASTHCLPQH